MVTVSGAPDPKTAGALLGAVGNESGRVAHEALRLAIDSPGDIAVITEVASRVGTVGRDGLVVVSLQSLPKPRTDTIRILAAATSLMRVPPGQRPRCLHRREQCA